MYRQLRVFGSVLVLAHSSAKPGLGEGLFKVQGVGLRDIIELENSMEEILDAEMETGHICKTLGPCQAQNYFLTKEAIVQLKASSQEARLRGLAMNS